MSSSQVPPPSGPSTDPAGQNSTPAPASPAGQPTGQPGAAPNGTAPGTGPTGTVPPGQAPPYGPGGPVPPYGPGGPGYPRPAGASFFASVRRLGIVRSDERWVGGVAGGVARRLGVDPVLVRCVWLVLNVFTGVSLILYGLGWLLLPEESDGRIHAEQVLHGRVEAGLVGAVACMVIGTPAFIYDVFPIWSAGSWVGSVLVSILWTGLAVGGVYWLSQQRRAARYGDSWGAHGAYQTGSVPGPQPDPARGQAPRPASYPAPTATYPGPHASYPGFPPRAVRRALGPGRSLSLLVLGLILLASGCTWVLNRTGHLNLVQCVILTTGIPLVLLGAGLIISSLRGRRGGWMTGLGWLVVPVALPMLAVTSTMPPGSVDASFKPYPVTIVVTDAMLQGTSPDHPLDLGSYVAGSVTVDLQQVSDLSVKAHARITMGVGDVQVLTRQGQPLQIRSSVSLGVTTSRFASRWSTSGDAVVQSGGTSGDDPDTYLPSGEEPLEYSVRQTTAGHTVRFTSPTATDDRGLDLDVSVGTGDVRVREDRTDSVTWYGSTSEHVWVVDSWTGADGVVHDGDDLPVPGMTHPAVSSRTATECVRSALDDVDDRPGYDWSSVNYLSSRERHRYDSCVSQALSTPSPTGTGTASPDGAQPEATQPGATPSPAGMTTPTPTAVPTH
ncbi:PspC domain-containing protein [uncultured Actinomyces sp.]|uniref:PspC domain-containing protein n=1 Tax=uncultured Actinomyces sp. TaxID=249061 RepID=UPI00261ECC8E|nr:PspC domain-containing protein [uncultured Actinomyces sp.]